MMNLLLCWAFVENSSSIGVPLDLIGSFDQYFYRLLYSQKATRRVYVNVSVYLFPNMDEGKKTIVFPIEYEIKIEGERNARVFSLPRLRFLLCFRIRDSLALRYPNVLASPKSLDYRPVGPKIGYHDSPESLDCFPLGLDKRSAAPFWLDEGSLSPLRFDQRCIARPLWLDEGHASDCHGTMVQISSTK
jgi:hypothetical protein